MVGQHCHIHEKDSIEERHMISSMFLQECPTCTVRFIRMVLEMGDKWPYNCCFVGCCFRYLFNVVRSILGQFEACVCVCVCVCAGLDIDLQV